MKTRMIESRNEYNRFRRMLAIGLVLLLVLPMFQFSGSRAEASAQERELELTLTQTKPDNGFVMIPGMPIVQDIAVNLGKCGSSCFVYVRVTETNNEESYLTYEMAEGWLPLLTPDGDHVKGVYYRQHDGMKNASWMVLADGQIMVNAQTVTRTVLEQLAANPSAYPRLTYEAFGIMPEEADNIMDAYDGWCVLNGSGWRVEYTSIDSEEAVVSALALSEGLSLDAYDVHLVDEMGNYMQPVDPVEVRLPAGTEADAAVVLHELSGTNKIIEAIRAGKAVALQTDKDQVKIVEAIEADVEGGCAVFDATSFSTYYVVSGHNETLKSWWQDSSGGTNESNTRYNVDRNIYGLDSSDTTVQTYYVEPDSTVYLYVKDDTVTKREITKDTSGGTITLIGAVNDDAGLLVKVSGTATEGQEMTFTVNDEWTIRIIVDGNVIEETFDNTNYPVYVGITFNPITISIANEPRVSGNDTNDWTYITNMSDLTMTGSSSSYKQKDVIAPVEGSKATDYLLASIKGEKFLEGTDDDSVKGLIDTEMTTDDGYPPTVELDQFVCKSNNENGYTPSINWEAIAEKLLKDSNISSKIKATDGTTPTMTNYGQVGGYVLQPYVVKLQTSKYVGWHINACFVPVRDANTPWMNFDENLPEGAYIDYLNVPLRKPLKTGSTDATTALMYSVQPGGVDYEAISESVYITLSDGRKLRFIGWNTQSDGTGCQYPGQGATYSSPSNDGNYWKTGEHNHLDESQIAGIKEKNPFLDGNTGTMYAFWSAIAERLELHKIVQTDDVINSPQSFTFRLTITSLEGVQISPDGGDKIVVEVYDSATGKLASSQPQKPELKEKNSVDISMTANQYAAIFLPKGTQYKIEEYISPGSNYEFVNAVNAVGTVGGKGNDGNVIFTNSYNSTKGFLNLEKTVEGEGADLKQLFTFTVTFDDSTIANEGKRNDVEFTLYDELDKAVYDTSDRVTVKTEGSSYTVLLKHGERIVFSGLEAGTTYTITESAVENYAATVTTQVGTDAATTQPTNTASGSIVEDKFTNVVYTNNYNPPVTDGTLTIKKEFSGCTPEPGESFVFTVKDATNAEVAEVVIYGAGSKIISLPYGEYTVTEDDSWSWRYSAGSSNPQTAIVSSTPTTVTFTNTKTNERWLDASAGVTNNFGNGTEVQTPTPTEVPNGGEQE